MHGNCIYIKTITMLSVFMFFSAFPYVAFSSTSLSSFSKIQLPPTVTGPESVVLDPRGEGPYAAVSDGRVLKWQGPNTGWLEFATTAPNRNKQLCDGTTDPNLGPICGRPLGFSFYSLTGELYIVDAFLGLYVVGPKGGLATKLATSADGVPFRSLDGIDVDQFTGIVYFTDATTTYDLRNISQPNFTPDSTGRLLKYNRRTNQVTVLLKDLSVPIGPAINIDGTSIFFSEYTTKRIIRYWLIGLKANTAEIFLNLPGNPSKVKRSTQGNLIVAVNVRTQQPTTLNTPLGLRFDAFSKVLETLNFSAQYYNTTISVVQEQNGKIFIGSRFTDFVGFYS